MSKEFQEFPDQRREGAVHDKLGDGERLTDDPLDENYLFTHVLEQIRKQSAVPGAPKFIDNPLKAATKDSFIQDGTVDTLKIRTLRRRLQREGFSTVNHPDWPSFFTVEWK